MEDFLVEILMNGEREAQIQAANQIGELSSKKRHRIAEKGVMVPLISMLHSQDFDVIEAALYSLLSLAFGSERNKGRIVKLGAMPALINLLQCQSKDLVELTIAAMLTLSSCSANKLQIASSASIRLLINFLNQQDPNPNANNTISISIQAKLDIITTLHNLANCPYSFPSIVSSGVVLALLQLLQASEKSSELSEKTMALLNDIVSSSEIALREAARTDGALQVLVDMMEEGSPECKENAVRILLSICRSCREKYRRLILREGVMPGLLQLSVDGTRRGKRTARELLFLLRDCSDNRGGNRQPKHALIEYVMQEIDAVGEKVEGTTLRLVEEMIAKLST